VGPHSLTQLVPYNPVLPSYITFSYLSIYLNLSDRYDRASAYFAQVDITPLMSVALPTSEQMKIGHCSVFMNEWSIFCLPTSQWLKCFKNHNALGNGIKWRSFVGENNAQNVNHKQSILLFLL